MAIYEVKGKDIGNVVKRHVKVQSNGSYEIIVVPSTTYLDHTVKFIHILNELIDFMDSTGYRSLEITREA